MTKEAEAPTISVIPDDTIDMDKGYYHGVYVLLNLTNKKVVDRRDYQEEMEADKYE